MTTSTRRPQAAATTALLAVVVDRAAPETLGRQLYLRIRELILAGRLAAGERLPSTRRLAEDLGVSRTVPLAAYDQLAAEGYIDARRGSGQYVRALDGTVRPTARRAAPAPAAAQEPLAPALRGQPFDPDAAAAALFPAREWARMMARGWRRDGAAAIGPDQWSGLRSLRAAIAGHVRALQGLDVTAEQVAVTAGVGDALQLIARALVPRGAEVWVEDPGHIGARHALAREGLRVVPVPVDAEGIDVAAGRWLAPHARLALVTPQRQFPSGAPLSLPRRIALIDWARQAGAVVVADDYDSELRFSGRPMAALSSLDPGQAVLSVGSFSKLTFPGLRLGYVVGPQALIARLAQARAREGAPVAMGAQPAMAEFISGGGFARHLRALRRQMGQRRQALAAALAARLGEAVAILPQDVGMHLTIALREGAAGGMSDVEVAALGAARGLNLDPLSSHGAASPAPQGFLLGYAGWDEQRLAAGVETLARLLADCARGAVRLRPCVDAQAAG
ncbi:MAG: PLP-dependent aminotransferase family protein [Caulobacteraceae bacterium]|nr:PLP-dependent aminotransferase family protein [Caulobacteraceae bacterium]